MEERGRDGARVLRGGQCCVEKSKEVLKVQRERDRSPSVSKSDDK